MTTQEQIDFITGPQVPISDTWLDRTLVERGKFHGRNFPAAPPQKPLSPVEPLPQNFATLDEYKAAHNVWASDPVIRAYSDALDTFLNMHYYDLGLAEACAYRRTNDPEFLSLFEKIEDSFWLSPWINGGKNRNFDQAPPGESQTPTPRNCGLGSLILRAMNRPEMWDWINAYTRAQFDAWLKIRINNAGLHNGVRDGAFMLHYATWLAKVLPDSFPLQAGGTATNGAQLRAQYLADIEAVSVNYFARLQHSDGSWRWDDFDASGGPYIGIMQPFMVGLLLCALCDAHQIVTTPAVKLTIQEMILNGCRHLYAGGPYSKQLVPHFNVNLRGFHYTYHGGTQSEPAKYENGDFPFDTTTDWHVSSARQAISTILPAFGYAYKISGDSFFKIAGDEMYNSAYGGEDGFRSMIDNTAKNYNQHARRVGSYLAWAGDVVEPVPLPVTEPVPEPIPTTPLEPAKTSSPNGTKATTVIDSELRTWTIGAGRETLRDDVQMGGGQGSEYKYWNTIVYVLGTDSQYWGWINNKWNPVGAEPGVTQPAPTPTPEPVPEPITRQGKWPSKDVDKDKEIEAQWKDGYRLAKTNVPGAVAIFEKVK